MKNNIIWLQNRFKKENTQLINKYFPKCIGKKTLNFHKQINEYKITPLHNLSNLAKDWNLGGMWVKDESFRFGLNAFKALGSSYAIYQHIKKLLNLDDFNINELNNPDLRKKLGNIIFATATDGNHGKGVAWAAKKLGYPAVVYMPKGTVPARVKAIEDYGARVEVLDVNYDLTVNKIKEDAAKNNWTVISDTSWENYEEIPTWVQQGYCTLFQETQEQLVKQNIAKPTHVFLQAGVGAMAVSGIGYYQQHFPDNNTKYVILEPHNAACLYSSANTTDGQAFEVQGDLETIMAGLSCGKPSDTAWPIIRANADAFLSCPDQLSINGIRKYANPKGNDPMIVSGESGALGLGCVDAIMNNLELSHLKELLNLNKDSHILLVNTEGDTDPVNYKKILS